MKRAFVCLSLLAAELTAGAQGPQYVPIVGPSPAEVDALEAGGHHKKRIGAILMYTGGALAVVGTGLMIGGAWHVDDHCCCTHYGYTYYDAYYHRANDGGCGNDALSIAGATTAFVGLGALVPGIFVYVSGGSDVDEARRLRWQLGY